MTNGTIRATDRNDRFDNATLSTPGAVLLTHLFSPVFFHNDPFHVIGNGDDLEFRAVPVRLSAQLFHDLDQPAVIARNQYPASIEAWLLRAGGLRPIGPVIRFIKGIRLP